MFGRKKDNEPQWDQDIEPFMKQLLGKKGIKTKQASEVGRKKVDYFRGKDFKKFVQSSEELLNKKCSAALKAAGVSLDGKSSATDRDVDRLGMELVSKSFCYKAAHVPVNSSSKDGNVEKKPKKWPDRLQRMPNQTIFDSEAFYVIVYEGNSGWQHFLLALIIVGVLLVCMWPVWPIWAKIGIWYLSVIFLSLYFGVLILRMVVYTMFWVVGFDFWIFPNLNDEYCGFLDSFKPMYSWEKRKDDALMLLVRFGSLGIVAVAIEQISQTCSIHDVGELVMASYADVIDWGVDKIMALPGSEREALPSLESIQSWEDGSNDTNASNYSTVEEVAPGKEDDDDDVIDVDAPKDS
jgi:translocation protein SEC62